MANPDTLEEQIIGFLTETINEGVENSGLFDHKIEIVDTHYDVEGQATFELQLHTRTSGKGPRIIEAVDEDGEPKIYKVTITVE